MTEPLRMPALQVEAAPANPYTGGLFSAASVETVPDPPRLDGGLEVTPVNFGGHGTWPTGCDPDDEGLSKDGPREGRNFHPSLIVWAADDCGLIGNSREESEARAQQLLRLYEQVDTEEHTAPRLLAAAGTPATVATGDEPIVMSLGALEAALALQTGAAGVIHADRRWAPYFAAKGQVVSVAGRLQTPLGNVWAFGAGYGALGDTLVATRPVSVRKSSISVNTVAETRRNERSSVAERYIAVSWEQGAWAQALA